MTSFIYQKLNSQMALTFSKNVNEEAIKVTKKQVIFFLTAVFRPVIHTIYFIKYCLLTLLLFSFFSHFPSNFCFKFKVKYYEILNRLFSDLTIKKNS